MKELHSLIHTLTSSEWQGLQVFLTAFTPRDPERLKDLGLAKMLMEKEEAPSAEACCLKLYGQKKSAGFNMLKSRLREKIFDFLVTDTSTDKKQALDKTDQAYIRIKKLSALYKYLFHSKPKPALCYDVLDELISLAKKYENFHTAVEFLHEKRVAYLSMRSGAKEFEEISDELNKYIIKQQILMKTEQYYHTLMMLYDYNGKCDKKKVDKFLTAIIAEVGKDYKQTQSPRIHYYLKIFEMDHYQLHEKHLEAKNTCLELLNIVRNNKSVYRKERVGMAYDHLSRCEYYLSNYKQAAEWGREAQKHFNLGSDNYCVALEQEFYALLAMKDYDKAKEAADKMRTGAAKEELGAFRHAKYNFLFANALFKLGRYKEVITLLSQGLEISKDKAGWEIGIRVLGIMACLELERFNEAAFSIERLRKFIAFTEKKTPVSVRDKTIGSLLQALEKQAFAFTSLSAKAGKYLELLSSKEKEYGWEPFTHEVIPFHEWLKSKCKISKIEPKGTAPFTKELIKE